MPQKYSHCIDCGKEKTTYSQQKSSRCMDCAFKAGAVERFMRCVDCGTPKNTASAQRSSRCRTCAMKQLRGPNNSGWGGGPVTIACETCGCDFQVIRSRAESGEARFCSSKCYGVWRSENIRGDKLYNWKGGKRVRDFICLQCDTVFQGRPSASRKFCSRKCVGQSFSENASGENSKLWNGGPPECVCEVCGKAFLGQQSNPNRFCSIECKGIWQRANRSGENHYNWKGGPIESTCEYCDTMFQRQRTYGAGRFCSRKCYERWQSENLSGENSYQWLGGKSFEPYSPKFNRALKERIRERDERCCVLCGKSQEDNGRKLSVHHTLYDKADCDPDRMVSLCISCHAKTNRNRPFWIQVFTKYRGRKPKQDWQRRVVLKGELSMAA